ncbi:hypothetical protein [Mycobacterium botniense]|uniref:hypothetical protein n=1 Tax=Mycobacterium botniense TaxID=84962 RepID=UPI0013D89C20|nr:hypothetical protein [Mycobacterium botniense]
MSTERMARFERYEVPGSTIAASYRSVDQLNERVAPLIAQRDRLQREVVALQAQRDHLTTQAYANRMTP